MNGSKPNLDVYMYYATTAILSAHTIMLNVDPYFAEFSIFQCRCVHSMFLAGYGNTPPTAERFLTSVLYIL